jgi:hypothetical protein
VAAGGTREIMEAIPASAPDFDAKTKPKPQSAPASATGLNGFDLTEDGIALAFAAQHKDELRYWRREETKLASAWARDICRRYAAQADNMDKSKISKSSFAAAVERFAQADRIFAETVEAWDRDPWLLARQAAR